MAVNLTTEDYISGRSYSTPSSQLFKRSYEFISISILGISLNSFVVYLSFFGEEKMKHYRYFIANSALMSILHAISMLFRSIAHTSHAFLGRTMHVFTCTAVELSTYTAFVAILCTYTPIIYCRYKEIVGHRKCSKKRITLLLLFPYSPFLASILVVSFAKKVVVRPNCAILTIPEINYPVSLFAILPFTFCAQFFYSFKLYYHLKSHFYDCGSKVG